MSPATPPTNFASHATAANWSAWEAVLKRFEEAWRGPTRPDLLTFLPDPPPARLAAELAHVDLEFRLRAGDPARVEDYLSRLPVLADDDLVLDLIQAEYALRARSPDPARPEDYELRFPDLGTKVRDLLADPQTPTRVQNARPVFPVGVPIIKGYDVVGELGRGGMGVVYKAQQPALDRMVAIKTLAWQSAEAGERFRREAEAIARLDHPHIVPVYEVGIWGQSIPYFVMKWYPGGSLAETEAGPGTDLRGHVRIVEAVARAVHHAHQRGILHRDLKPGNVLLDEEGQPHVVDFGLAGRFDPDAPKSLTAAVVGTPAYMAPEQAIAPSHVTTAADVYGVGALLYERLTGNAPFNAETALATLELVTEHNPEPPSAVNPAVPRDLEAVCLKCLAKEPADRYASAEALADDLDRWLTGRPVLARHARPWERAWRAAKRYPVFTGLSLLTAVALIVTVVTLAVSNARIRKKEVEATTARDELSEALKREQRLVAAERMASAGRLYLANQLPQAWDAVDRCPPDFRGWEWRYLTSLRRAGPLVLTGHQEAVSGVAFLSDGRLVSADAAGVVRVWDPAAGDEVKSWRSGPRAVSALAAHPKRPWVATASAAGTDVWDAAGRRVHRLPGSGWVAFRPDGGQLACGSPAGVTLWETAGWTRQFELTGHRLGTLSGAYSPDGSRLVTSSLDRTVRTWDPRTGKPVGEPWTRQLPVIQVAYSSDGSTVLEAHSTAVWFVDAATGASIAPAADSGRRPVLGVGPRQAAVAGPHHEVFVGNARGGIDRTFRGHSFPVTALAFNGDGKRLASASLDRAIYVWDTTRDPEVTTLPNLPDPWAVATSPTGRRLALSPRPHGSPADHSVAVFEMSSGERAFMVPGCGGVAYSPDSRWLAAGRRGGGVTVWDAATGTEVRTCPVPNSLAMRVTFTLDSRRLIAGDAVGAVRIWDTTTWAEPTVLATGVGTIAGLDVSPDDRHVVATGRTGAEVWSLDDGTLLQRLREDFVFAAEFSVDGRRLALAERARVRLFDAATWKEQPGLGHPGGAEALAFSPDGRRLVTAGPDPAVRVWDVDLAQEVLSLPGARPAVVGLCWDHANDRVIAVDTQVRIWDPGRAGR